MSEQSDELTIWEVAGLLRLRVKAARNWVRRHVPEEAIQRQGNKVLVAQWGINAALKRCTWRPRSPRGFQGCPGRVPPNVGCRDELGRFCSHHSGPPPPKRKKPFIHPQVRRYVSN